MCRLYQHALLTYYLYIIIHLARLLSCTSLNQDKFMYSGGEDVERRRRLLAKQEKVPKKACPQEDISFGAVHHRRINGVCEWCRPTKWGCSGAIKICSIKQWNCEGILETEGWIALSLHDLRSRTIIFFLCHKKIQHIRKGPDFVQEGLPWKCFVHTITNTRSADM